jgi:hypothetical protein
MRLMRFVLALTPSVLAAASLSAQSELRPAPSGRGLSEVTLSKPVPQGQDAGPEYRVRVDYGQPHLRGRALHTDSLVPYGRPWRTGANDATTLTTEVDLVIGGAAIAKGKYVLFTIPNRAAWTLVIQKDVNQGGEYKQENDVARVEMKARQLAAPLESLTMWLIPAGNRSAPEGELRMAWGTSEATVEWMVK